MKKKIREVLTVDYRWIDEVPLEVLKNEKFLCKALIHRDWKRIYLLNIRKDWLDSEYFDFAEKRFKEIGLENP